MLSLKDKNLPEQFLLELLDEISLSEEEYEKLERSANVFYNLTKSNCRKIDFLFVLKALNLTESEISDVISKLEWDGYDTCSFSQSVVEICRLESLLQSKGLDEEKTREVIRNALDLMEMLYGLKLF